MNRQAILIGNSNYPIDSGLQDLRCPENDVEGMYAILGDKKYGGFNEPLKLKNCTTSLIKREMGKVLGSLGREDLVLIYYSGHGKLDIQGRLYLATADTSAASSFDLISTALSVSEIHDFIRNSNTNKVIFILDCCYAGSVGRSILKGGDASVALANMDTLTTKGADPSVALGNIDEGRGMYILTSSTNLQTSQEKEEDQYGLLTKHIIYGIRTGDADTDKNGSVSMDDLYEYVFDMVRKEGPQTPMHWALNVQGKDLTIARVSNEEVVDRSPDSNLKPKRRIELEKLEPPGGVVRLGSPFYIARKADENFLAAVKRRDTIVLVKGARQMGKTSLLSRGLQQARQDGAKVAVSDFQVLGYEDFKTLKGFYFALGNLLSDKLNLDLLPEDVWNEKRGATINFGRYMRQLLEAVGHPLVWGLDEVDRLFTHTDGSEVFGLFRSWYNDVQLDPDSPWKNLTMVISYATEASLFIKDINQSPFNVGTRLTLSDFTREEVDELNRRHQNPLATEGELQGFYDLLAGHPYLVRCGLYEMVIENLAFLEFQEVADDEGGPFGDHLRRFIELLDKDPEIEEDVRAILRGNSCSTESFYRLRSAGLMAGESAHDVRPRCKLYEMYLRRHLL